MAKFKARLPRGTRERVMFDILTYTGLRIGDVSVLGRQHVRNGVIRIDNEKTGMRVTIPMLAPLKATLDARPTGDLAFIVSRRGTPFNKGALGAAFVEAAGRPASTANRPTASARWQRRGQRRTEQPSVSWRLSSASPGEGWRRYIPGAQTERDLQQVP
jgi:integrase